MPPWTGAARLPDDLYHRTRARFERFAAGSPHRAFFERLGELAYDPELPDADAVAGHKLVVEALEALRRSLAEARRAGAIAGEALTHDTRARDLRSFAARLATDERRAFD